MSKTKKPIPSNIPCDAYIKKWKRGPHSPDGANAELIALGFKKSTWSTFMQFDIAIGRYCYALTADLIDFGGKGDDEFDFTNVNVGRCLRSEFEDEDGNEVWSCAKRGTYNVVLKWFKAKLKK